ncbi:MAG: helix-turn-helix domain-containing protein [Gordonia sp. (in: high G+C Gram-positive bacteria)]|uniref:helix-turn-helix domain-containing protein n=1 Tax=Gordonia sp. (in: high G+C Gram-positive bacteria) TaxID=84139 RepID=UPI0039E217AE
MPAVSASDSSAHPRELYGDLRVFRRDEVADRLGVSVDVVDRLINAGEMTTVRPRKKGRIVQIPARSLRTYIYGDDA